MALRVFAGVEDLLLDGDAPEAVVTQIRNNQAVLLHKINAYTIPVSGKYGEPGFVSIQSQLMTTAERTKLSSIPSNANYYVHPTSHPISMIKVATGNHGKFLRATGCCVTYSDVTWDTVINKPTEFKPQAHSHSQYTTVAKVNQLISGKSNIGHTHDLADMSGLISANKVEETCQRLFVNKNEKAIIANAVTKDTANKPLGYVQLDANGNLPCSSFKQINIGKFVPVNSTSDMLAIQHTCTDNNCVVAIRTDYTGALGTYPMYALTALPASNINNWKGINASVSVNSVNGMTGNVSLCTDDVPEGTNNLYYTEQRVYQFIKKMFIGSSNCGLDFDDVTSTATMLCGFIKKPVILDPVNNSVDWRDDFNSSPYQTTYIYNGTHDSSDWELYSDSTLTTLVDSYSGNANLTQWVSSYIADKSNTTFYVRVRYISATYRSEWSDAVCFTTPAILIATPTINVTANATNMNLSSTITGSPFTLIGAAAGVTDTHIETDWVIRNSSTNSVVWSSLADTVNLTSITVPFGILTLNTQYKVEVRYRGANYGI